jgi:hypothetical protein
MLKEPHQPVTVDVVKEAFDVGVQNPVHSLFGDRNVHRIKSLMLATLRPEAITETDEVFFVDALQNRADSMLDDLVLNRGDPQRPFSTVGLLNVHPLGRLRSESSAVNATVKIDNAIFQALLVFVPCHLIDADGCLLLELIEARSQLFDINMMKQGSELELTTLASRLTHTGQST